jgi:HEAT repeat protein
MLGAAAAAGTVAPLGRALQDPEPAVRHAAALALAGLGDQAQAAVPSLLAASQDPDLDVRQRVLGALAAGAAPASVVGPALVRGLRDSAAVVREAVAIGLGERRPHGVRALGGEQGATASPLRALRAATRDPVTGVRLAAVTSLGLLGDSAGRPDLERALTDPDAVVRREAAHALTALHRRGGARPVAARTVPLRVCVVRTRDGQGAEGERPTAAGCPSR